MSRIYNYVYDMDRQGLFLRKIITTPFLKYQILLMATELNDHYSRKITFFMNRQGGKFTIFFQLNLPSDSRRTSRRAEY